MSKTPKLNLKKLCIVPEPLNKASPDREACQICGRYKTKPAFVMPIVPEEWTRRLVAVCSFPSMTKPVRKLVAEIWERAKYKKDDVAFVPVVRCLGAAEPDMKQIMACRPFLLKALRALKPRYCLGLGSSALRSLRNSGDGNVTKARGKLIDYEAIPQPPARRKLHAHKAKTDKV